jgi:alkanesulfonate monooxygenase SsuD/methylene tetrahydromethanopterin reductase-like flavin-dependent oxidoreductase (luciferase family)
MDIGIGLPTTLDVAGPTVRAWARLAEERGFAALASVDRIVYPNYDALTALTFAAGATSRIGLFSDVLLGPIYPPIWLAKATAALGALSGDRFTLGLGVGGREDDFAAMHVPMNERGKRMDDALDILTRAWAFEAVEGDQPVVPKIAQPVPILVGGTADAAVDRTVKYGAGWTGGGAGPEQTGQMAARIRTAWADAGRAGEPRIAALGYFGLGDDAASEAALRRYYGFLGEYADVVVNSALRTPEAITGAVAAFAAAGVTELVLNPTIADVDQVDRLADIVF